MTTRNNIGPFNCYAAALPDEPIFTLLARDPAAPQTIRFWISERERIGKNVAADDIERLNVAGHEIPTFAQWRAKHLDPVGDGIPAWRHKRQIEDDRPPVTEVRPEPNTGPGVSGLPAFDTFTVESTIYYDDDEEEMSDWKDKIGSGPTTDPTMADSPHVLALKARIRSLEAEIAERAQRAKITTREWHTYEDTECENPIIVTPLSFSRMHELLDYGTAYGEFDEYTLNGAQTQNPNTSSPMTDMRRASIWMLKRCMGIISEDAKAPTPTDNPEPEDDLAASPDMPPHRFSLFHKSQNYAYARGLEVSPTHLPRVLDEMQKDGWHLLSIFGATDSKHVGFIFKAGYRSRNGDETTYANGGARPGEAIPSAQKLQAVMNEQAIAPVSYFDANGKRQPEMPADVDLGHGMTP